MGSQYLSEEESQEEEVLDDSNYKSSVKWSDKRYTTMYSANKRISTTPDIIKRKSDMASPNLTLDYGRKTVTM